MDRRNPHEASYQRSHHPISGDEHLVEIWMPRKDHNRQRDRVQVQEDGKLLSGLQNNLGAFYDVLLVASLKFVPKIDLKLGLAAPQSSLGYAKKMAPNFALKLRMKYACKLLQKGGTSTQVWNSPRLLLKDNP
jgi:hypothetical protein